MLSFVEAKHDLQGSKFTDEHIDRSQNFSAEFTPSESGKIEEKIKILRKYRYHRRNSRQLPVFKVIRSMLHSTLNTLTILSDVKAHFFVLFFSVQGFRFESGTCFLHFSC